MRLRLKMWLLKAEVLETLLYGCATWSPEPADYEMLLRCLSWRKRKYEDHTLPYAHALVKTDSESIEATVRR